MPATPRRAPSKCIKDVLRDPGSQSIDLRHIVAEARAAAQTLAQRIVSREIPGKDRQQVRAGNVFLIKDGFFYSLHGIHNVGNPRHVDDAPVVPRAAGVELFAAVYAVVDQQAAHGLGRSCAFDC